MKKTLTFVLLLTMALAAQAQDLEAVQKAAEEARKAEQRAAEARKNAEEAAKRVEEARKRATKNNRQVSNVPTEDFLKLVEEQKKMKEKSQEKRAGRIGRTATDSLRWVKNQMKLH